MLLNKQKLSGSPDGRGIKVVAVISPGTTIHTAQAGIVQDTFDEIWLWVQNMDSVTRVITIEFGGTNAPDDNISIGVANTSGLLLLVPGLILQNSSVVRAFASAANVLIVFGFVNKISP